LPGSVDDSHYIHPIWKRLLQEQCISRPPACKWMRADEAVLINGSEAMREDTSHYWEDIGVAK
jgi:hypothetical protein